MFKGSLLFLPDSCTTPLSAELYALTHPPSLLVNRGRLWTFDLDKSWVRGRYNSIRDIRWGHTGPFCVHVSAQLEWTHACTLLIKRNYLIKIFCLSYVCFWHWRVFNSNNLGIWSGILHSVQKEGSLAVPWGDTACCLVWQPRGSADGDNFLDLWINSESRISWQCR
jgi:hypothetical protein